MGGEEYGSAAEGVGAAATGPPHGFKGGVMETVGVVAGTPPVNMGIKLMGGKPYKRYRIFEKVLA